jgi:hemoglobin-like flavoprotein
MTPQQVNLIKSSFATIFFTRDESAKLFYDRLFTVAPRLRPLFKSDMESQGRKLMDTLSLAVTALRHPQSLDHLLYDTSKRHVGYGATPADYDLVGDALLWMLEQQLGKDYTPEVRVAWTELYGAVSGAMQRIGQEPMPAKEP